MNEMSPGHQVTASHWTLDTHIEQAGDHQSLVGSADLYPDVKAHF